MIAGALASAFFDPHFTFAPGMTPTIWLVLLAIGSQVIGWLLIGVALPKLPVIETSVLLLGQPVFTVIWGVSAVRRAAVAIAMDRFGDRVGGSRSPVVPAALTNLKEPPRPPGTLRMVLRCTALSAVFSYSATVALWVAATSAAARSPLSTAPFMYPCHLMLVCSPAKKRRPQAVRAMRAAPGRSRDRSTRSRRAPTDPAPRRSAARRGARCPSSRASRARRQARERRRGDDRLRRVARAAARQQREDAGASALLLVAVPDRAERQRRAERARPAGARQNRCENCSSVFVAAPY